MINKANITHKVSARISAVPDSNKFTANDINELKRVTDNIIDGTYRANDNLVLVSSLSDLPSDVVGVITLAENTAYWITKDVDLEGRRIVCGRNTTLLGSSSENSVLRSTGLSGAALITSEYSLPMRHLAITADIALNLNGDGVTTAIDWFGVNFVDCNSCGGISNYSNFIAADCAWLNSGPLIFNGTIGTAGFSQNIFVPRESSTAIVLPSTLTITRRFRVIYSAFVVLSGRIGIDVSVDADIPTEGYILDNVSFGGPGVKTTGVSNSDNKSQWNRCTGVNNSTSVANMYIKNNDLETTVVAQGERYPIEGISQVSSVLQRFEHVQSENSIQYKSPVSRLFKIQASLSVLGPNNAVLGLYIGVCRSPGPLTPNEDRIEESEIYLTTSGSKPDSALTQSLVSLNEGDRVYCIAQNTSGTGDITVQAVNLIATEQN